MSVSSLLTSVVVAVVAAGLTSLLARRREARGRAVAARRAAVLDVQEGVVRFRVARARHGQAMSSAAASRPPGEATILPAPEVDPELLRAVFEAETTYKAALARLEPAEVGVESAAQAWTEASLVASLSKEVDAAGEESAFDAVNAAVRTALGAIGD